MSARVITLGCRLNSFESEVIKNRTGEAGLDNAVVINTCAVTSEAERQARQTIRRARREHPEARIIVTGCSAQVDADRYANMPEVDQVLGNEEKLRMESYLPESSREPVVVSDIMRITETAGHLVEGFESRTRAFVQIQQGCDHRCTFCIIPFGRGNNRSVPVGTIVDQIEGLTSAGYREVVLTGVDISSYGTDLPGQPTLGELVRRILALVPDLPRLRLSSLDPAVRDPALMLVLSTESRLMPHIHLSAQAGNDLVLKRMKRRHSREGFLRLCGDLRASRPDVVLGADFITGFPTETPEMFAETLSLVDEAELTYLHVFPYSERPGTPAARMPPVPKPVRHERARRLREAGNAQRSAYLDSRIGECVRILVESDGRGYTEHYAPAQLAGDTPRGVIVDASIDHVAGGHLIARAA